MCLNKVINSSLGSFVELASADKPAGDALPDISEDGPTDPSLI